MDGNVFEQSTGYNKKPLDYCEQKSKHMTERFTIVLELTAIGSEDCNV